MPILAHAKKALRQAIRRTVFNRPIKSRVKTMSDLVKKTPSLDNLKKAYSAIDTAVKRNIFHKNKAARLKSQLSKLLAKAAK
ncbi:MAG TPA: 30S ribosomal protein S20 [Patescibacteria group bacterium]|nr:30S ribosomal protein S20 [Patescibacteria group bacterium]